LKKKGKTPIIVVITEKTKLTKKGSEAGQSIRCPILPNWMTRKDRGCGRYYRCRYREDPRCPAKAGI
jgi:hypothetical protein